MSNIFEQPKVFLVVMHPNGESDIHTIDEAAATFQYGWWNGDRFQETDPDDFEWTNEKVHRTPSGWTRATKKVYEAIEVHYPQPEARTP